MKKLKQPYSFLPEFWMNANAFKDAFACLWDQFEFQLLLGGATGSAGIVPPIVNAMLGIELYLKFLYGCENKFIGEGSKCYCEIIWTHNIKTLFDNLKEETKGKIICSLEESGIFKEKLLTFLKENNNDFIEWRYPQKHELSSDVTILRKILKTLFDICEDIMNCKFDMNKCNGDVMGGYSVTVGMSRDWEIKQKTPSQALLREGVTTGHGASHEDEGAV